MFENISTVHVSSAYQLQLYELSLWRKLRYSLLNFRVLNYSMIKSHFNRNWEFLYFLCFEGLYNGPVVRSHCVWIALSGLLSSSSTLENSWSNCLHFIRKDNNGLMIDLEYFWSRVFHDKNSGVSKLPRRATNAPKVSEKLVHGNPRTLQDFLLVSKKKGTKTKPDFGRCTFAIQ